MSSSASTMRLFVAGLGCALLAPATALAAGDAGENGAELGAVVIGILLIGSAYVLADKAVNWLQERFLVMSGVEYIVLGMALGSDALGISVFQNLTPILPIIALSAGWVGLLRGTQLSLGEVRASRRGLANVVMVHHAVTGSAVGVAAYFALRGPWLGVGAQEAAISAAALGCCAAADSASPFALLSKRYRVVPRLSDLLRTATRLGDVLVITAFGLIFCGVHENSVGVPTLSWFEWFGVTVGVGAVLGLLFRQFIEGGEGGQTSFLALVGIITFASGAAYFLKLSPLLVNLVMGLVLVRSAEGRKVREALESTERPMSLVLLVLAGALWKPSPLVATLVGIVAFVGLRLLAKAVGSRLASLGTELRKDLFRGLLTQGDVAVAMAVSFRLVYDGVAVDIAYSIILLSVVLHDLLGPRMMRGLLVDEGELTRETDAAKVAPSEAPADLGPSPSGEAT